MLNTSLFCSSWYFTQIDVLRSWHRCVDASHIGQKVVRSGFQGSGHPQVFRCGSDQGAGMTQPSNDRSFALSFLNGDDLGWSSVSAVLFLLSSTEVVHSLTGMDVRQDTGPCSRCHLENVSGVGGMKFLCGSHLSRQMLFELGAWSKGRRSICGSYQWMS